MRSLALASGALALAASLTGPRLASAYCRSSVCADGTEGHVCTPAEPDDCGKPFFWAEPCVGYDVQQNASKQIPWQVADQTWSIAFDTWQAVQCEGGPPSIKVADLGKVSCSTVQYNQTAGNANILIFRDGKWPHDDMSGGGNATDTIALTTVWYDPDTGQIYDADMEVNTHQFEFSFDDEGTATDLQSVLTHESGHFFGLAHSPKKGSTMYAYYSSGTSLRTLAADDEDAICAVYPPGREATGRCDYVPRHGFSDLCASDQTASNCNVVGPSESSSSGAGGFALFAALAGLASRRRRAAS